MRPQPTRFDYLSREERADLRAYATRLLRGGCPELNVVVLEPERLLKLLNQIEDTARANDALLERLHPSRYLQT